MGWKRERERGGVGEQARKSMPLQQYLVQFDNGMEWNLDFQSNYEQLRGNKAPAV